MRSSLLVSAVLVLTAGSARAETRIVHNGGDLQAALNAAKPGDEIRLEAGAVFRGNFVLPAKSGDGVITVRTDVPDASVPPRGTRVTPQAAAAFAKIESPGSESALRTAAGAHDWRLIFLEFRANKGGYGDIVQLGDGSRAQSSLDQVPHDIVLDRVYVHGDPELGQKRGIALNARSVTIRNSYIADIKAEGVDAQAICGWNGPGPFVIENNYLEASGENFLLGGADPAIRDLIPSDVVVRYNYMTRPMDWRGSRWQVKNIFELKNARRVDVEFNVFENNWLAAQPGYAIVLTPRNQDGACPWCTVESVVFSHNVVRNSSAGINISGHDSPHRSGQTSGIRVTDNLFTGITSRLGGNGWGVLIGDGPRDVSFAHNTFDFDGTTLLYAYGGDRKQATPIEGFRFTNNAGRHGEYGINGADASAGAGAIARFFPGGTFTGNVMRDDLDVNADNRAGADVTRLLELAEAVTKGDRPSGLATWSAR